MSVGYLGFVLLLWFPGVLHAHNETQNCTASSLSQGYVVPEQKTYLHEATLTYACDNGLKPAVEGWWATSKCQNGKWSPDPQCIDEKACVSLTIPNGNYDASTDGWYGDRDKIRVKCDEGYEHKDHDAAAQCSDGAWVSVPICERSTESCGDPPKKKHAVIIGKGYQEVFAASSKLQYKCEDGYTAEGADTKTIFCILGNWTEGPTCKVGTGGRHTTSAGSGVQPAGGDRIPDTGHGGATVGGTDGGDTTSAGSGRQPAGRAHNETQNCTASSLSQGYVVPEQKTYLHEATLTYACDNGLKPAVEGWWATSKCQNGKWSPDPQCIDEKACVSLTIPNGNYDASTDGWYGDRDKIRVKCDEGYEHKDHDATAQCSDGAWVSVPICERSTESCGDPPKKKHAVIIGKGYQEVFAASSKLQYKCEDGYTAEGADTKTIFCILGNWTEGPTCNRIPDTGHGGATVGGTGGGDTTSAGSGIQPAGREVGTGGGDTTSAGSGIQPAGRDRIPDTGHGGATVGGTGGGDTTSAGSGRQPAGRDANCGKHPSLLNGDVVEVSRTSLKYECNGFYTLEGPDIVTCQSNGKWTEPPSCKAAFCVIDPAQTRMANLKISQGLVYVKEGLNKYIPCRWPDSFRLVQCINGRISYTYCCSGNDHYYRSCPVEGWTENRSTVGSI
ncbi:complement factor H-like isoform X4 [Gymnodraco acuticeps]|uniref:Complement factor H-like isoform X4 n=1 Tax=Gymnodraco acuticeps TaxID=8218 RepID=A0A6P8UHD7_GYMAC|nr:complement factor H-like isoform X4 [Gymnodraco acuticeps]